MIVQAWIKQVPPGGGQPFRPDCTLDGGSVICEEAGKISRGHCKFGSNRCRFEIRVGQMTPYEMARF